MERLKQAGAEDDVWIDEFLDLAVQVYDLIDDDGNGTLEKAEVVRSRRRYFSDESRRRRGRDVDISLVNRGDAANIRRSRASGTRYPTRPTR